MIKNLFGLMLIVFGIGLVNISAQTQSEGKPISKGVLNGSAISLPNPPYPTAAKAVRARGAVNVQVVVDEAGNVISANAVSGHPLLRFASEKAARSAKFNPTVLSGKAVKVSGVIVYNFVPPTSADDSAKPDGNTPVTGRTNVVDSDVAPQGMIVNGSASNLVKPEYPAAAKAVRASGAVNVRVLIDENGNVEKAEAISGHPLLRQAAVNAALQSKFKPTKLFDQPVKVNGIVVFNFVP